ncbi:MAG: hypothetical protein ABJA70_09670 [Chryseolinea sp.]
MSREVTRGIEFLIITDWHDIEAIKQFAGDAYDIAVVPEQVQAMMIDYNWVRHYAVR